MTAIMLTLLLVAAVAAFAGVAALLVARSLYRRLAELREELAAHRAEASAPHVTVPGARTAPDTEEIRSAVAAALADERERELAEARAFWAAQDARDAAEAPVFDTHDVHELQGLHELRDVAAASGDNTDAEFEVAPFLPRQPDLAGLEPVRRHPSDPESGSYSPIITDPAGTVARLAELAESATPLADVRPGPLGTLDLYVFADGTTLCLTPGHSDTADKLAAAIDRGDAPVLVGGSGVSGAFTLTFAYGDENVFILADRVVASI
ncbi:hypothetical protein NGB36_07775 [Streptomyces sp. RB6PN25]|uniref:Secreted protein n=1 Tax=Streptomyces humicola TaxID=2953240 RepID=A0ABT1PS49_9ACTN|nr:hypothetical protein [Streptomyces humicola]MCQ4080502.1 hypothetical protein [Streptomyces humicola]